MNNLLQKTNFAEAGTIIDSPIKVKPTSPRNESPDLKYEDVTSPASDTKQQLNLSDTEAIVYNKNDVDYTLTQQLTILMILNFYKKDLYILGID